MPSKTVRSAFCLATLVGLVLSPVSGSAQDRTPAEIREMLLPTYQDVVGDPNYLAFQQQLAGRMEDRAAVDRMLEYLPLSPLEILRIDMFVKRYEIAVPRYLSEWHLRWIELHPDRAVEIYGEDYVAGLLQGRPEANGGQSPGGGQEAATVGTNRNAASGSSNPPLDYQGEVQVVVNPNDANQIVAATNTWDDGMQSVFYSSDGGVTWGHTFPPLGTDFGLGSCSFTQFGSDPALHWDDVGNVYLEYMALCSFISSTDYAIVVARSVDGGASWSPHGVVIDSWGTGDLEDKEFYAIDNDPGSPFYGRHYTCWDRNNDERFAYSTDSGASWTEVNLPDVAIDLGCEMAVGSDGTVHLVWDTLNCGASCSNERMFYTRSTDGGLSWSLPTLVRDFNLVGFSGANCPDAQDDRCIGPFGAIDVDNSGGACDGTLYTVFSDFTTGGVNETDVWLSRSLDNGASWSAPLKINDDGLTGRVQFHPFMEVDQSTGDVVVGWHDARNDPGNDAIDYYVARSTDCGVTFEANIQASQASAEFNNSGISFSNENSADNPGYNPNQYGEYMGVDTLNGKAYLAWSDTRHFFPSSTSEPEKENLGFVVVDFGSGSVCGNGVIEGSEECDGGDLGGATCGDVGCASGTPGCTASCTLDYSSCTDCTASCGNGTCESGEDCFSCPSDCISGSGASCGNGICEAGDGEDCLSCPQDCNGKQNGKPSNRFCCGDGAGENPVGCSDSRCTESGFDCTDIPVPSSCCGDTVCEGIEDSFNCELDCGAPPSCGDGVCNGSETECSCSADCGLPPLSETGLCGDGLDNDCDGLIDCLDTDDCGSDPLCSCLPSGASCTTNGECCSDKCKGPPGGKTCK